MRVGAHGLLTALGRMVRAFGRLVRPVVSQIGLADVLIVGGSIALTFGTVRLLGWSVALIVLGSLSVITGTVVARNEKKAGR